MKALVLGKKLSTIKDNDTGVVKKFAKLFVQHKVPPDNEYTVFEGQGCSVVAIPTDYYEDINVNGNYIIDFDSNGKLLEIEEL